MVPAANLRPPGGPHGVLPRHRVPPQFAQKGLSRKLDSPLEIEGLFFIHSHLGRKGQNVAEANARGRPCVACRQGRGPRPTGPRPVYARGCACTSSDEDEDRGVAPRPWTAADGSDSDAGSDDETSEDSEGPGIYAEEADDHPRCVYEFFGTRVCQAPASPRVVAGVAREGRTAAAGRVGGLDLFSSAASRRKP